MGKILGRESKGLQLVTLWLKATVAYLLGFISPLGKEKVGSR